MKTGFRKKKGGGDSSERLIQYNNAKAGCEFNNGEWNEKTKECTQRQIIDPDHPDEIVNKKFGEVKKNLGGITRSSGDDE